MMEASPERTRDDAAKIRFFLTGFTQAAGIRIYAFEGRAEAGRIDYTVEVDLALILGYGIRIQELPLLCRELLQQGAQPEGTKAFVFTEQRMRSHAEKLSVARQDAERRKKPPRHFGTAAPDMTYRPPLG
jgi:hypothetical protein